MERVPPDTGDADDREITQRILWLLAQVRSKPSGMHERHGRLAVKEKGRVVFLDLDEIDWIGAAANYVSLNVGKESYLLRETIAHMAERLDPSEFIRIHRSTIVNVGKIKELMLVNSGEYIVVLKTGKQLSCSRGYRGGLHRVIQQNS